MPYSERLKRRQAERQGRIHTTVFRLPELVAQTEADRRASEAEPSSPCPPVPQSSFDFPSENPGLSRTLEEPSRPQEPPRTPERSSGWNIRGLLSSVPRSFSRLIPRFGRSFEGTEESGMFPYCFSTTIICDFNKIKQNKQTNLPRRNRLLHLVSVTREPLIHLRP